MSADQAGALVDYRRAGGRAPADDEWLTVAVDGAFRARRTVGGRAIGAFAGRLGPDALGEVRAAVDAVAVGDDAELATPIDGATEVIRAAGRTLRTGSNARPPAPWTDLALRLRAQLDDVVTAPSAALTVQAGTRSAVLAHAGDRSLEIDQGTVVVRAVRLDADGLVLGRWQGRTTEAPVEDTAEPEARWEAVPPGWQLELPFRHGLELAPTDWLQVWVFLRLRGDQADAEGPDDPGPARAGRLFVAVPGLASDRPGGESERDDP